MKREDRLLKDVLKILDYSKGSVRNTIEKWKSNEQPETDDDEQIHVEWKPYPEVPYKHASGQYEPLSKDMGSFKNVGSKNRPNLNTAQMYEFPDTSSYEEQPSDH